MSETSKKYLIFEVGVIGLAGAWLAFETVRQMRVADEKAAKLK